MKKIPHYMALQQEKINFKDVSKQKSVHHYGKLSFIVAQLKLLLSLVDFHD
jgi:hypothetical protein